VDALESGGYVTRSPHPSDRRAIIVSLSTSSVRFMRDMQQDHADLSAELLDAVDVADRDALMRGITAIAARLRELIAAEEGRRGGEASTAEGE
jgi:DNA-binding MarR family transcriptional regulator